MNKKKPLKTSAMALLLITLVFMIAKSKTHKTLESFETASLESKTHKTLESFETASLESTSLEATVCIDPSTTTAEVYQKFSVNINISNVTDLYGWEFKLRWNSTVLEAVNVTEGDFLKTHGDTLFVININNTEGYARAACTLIGGIFGVNGNGTLASVEFYAETLGESILDLYDTKLVSSTEQPIEHTAIDGYYWTSVHDVAIMNGIYSQNLLK